MGCDMLRTTILISIIMIFFTSKDSLAKEKMKIESDVLMTRTGEKISGIFVRGDSEYILMGLDKGELRIPIHNVEKIIFSEKPKFKNTHKLKLNEPKNVELILERVRAGTNEEVNMFSGVFNKNIKGEGFSIKSGDRIEFREDGERFKIMLIINQSKRIVIDDMYLTDLKIIGSTSSPFKKNNSFKDDNERKVSGYQEGHIVSAKLSN
jgi:hypothetical protein